MSYHNNLYMRESGSKQIAVNKEQIMKNIELKIDGEVIVLTSQQTEQLKRAVKKETSIPQPKTCGGLLISCKPAGPRSIYPLIISGTALMDKENFPATYANVKRYGYDLSLTDVKSFIKTLKEFSAQIWATAKKELKNV